jgi:hypothetical protein
MREKHLKNVEEGRTRYGLKNDQASYYDEMTIAEFKKRFPRQISEFDREIKEAEAASGILEVYIETYMGREDAHRVGAKLNNVDDGRSRYGVKNEDVSKLQKEIEECSSWMRARDWDSKPQAIDQAVKIADFSAKAAQVAADTIFSGGRMRNATDEVCYRCGGEFPMSEMTDTQHGPLCAECRRYMEPIMENADQPDCIKCGHEGVEHAFTGSGKCIHEGCTCNRYEFKNSEKTTSKSMTAAELKQKYPSAYRDFEGHRYPDNTLLMVEFGTGDWAEKVYSIQILNETKDIPKTKEELVNAGKALYGLKNKSSKCTQCGKEVSQTYKGGMCSDCESEFERTHMDNAKRGEEWLQEAKELIDRLNSNTVLSENEKEIKIERFIDRLDTSFMAGGLEQSEYDAIHKVLDGLR